MSLPDSRRSAKLQRRLVLFFLTPWRETKMRTFITIALMFSFTSGELSAAHFRDGGFLANKGILESIRIEPRLPAAGESFSVNLAGSWSGMNPDGLCFAALEIDQVVVHAPWDPRSAGVPWGWILGQRG
jgi:hypothetical protein